MAILMQIWDSARLVGILVEFHISEYPGVNIINVVCKLMFLAEKAVVVVVVLCLASHPAPALLWHPFYI